MAPLRQVSFDPQNPDLVAAVVGFDCGQEPWQVKQSEWIQNQGEKGVNWSIQQFGTKVWLYADERGDLVGFGSLGKSRWHWPLATNPRIPIGIIPAVAIQRAFWGKPEGPREERYSTQILQHLIHEANRSCEAGEIEPLLGLFVHPDNVQAIRAYERVGFEPFAQTAGDHVSMILKLSAKKGGGMGETGSA